jgi:hypothetical protein
MLLRWHRGEAEWELEMNRHPRRLEWGLVRMLILFSAGGAKEYSPECSAAELREAIARKIVEPLARGDGEPNRVKGNAHQTADHAPSREL